MGRILKSVPIPEDELSADDASDRDPHPYRYDIEWVLGGRASNIERHELVYTTAEAEGMLEGGPRRKRKAAAAAEPAKTLTTAAATKQATKKRPKVAGGAKGKNKKAATASSNRKTANRVSGGKRKLQQAQLDPLSDDPNAAKQSGKDMYEKHRREFDRMLARIEKIDQFGFFLEDAPPGHEDDYEDNKAVPMAIDVPVKDDNCGGSSLEEKKDEDDSLPPAVKTMSCPDGANVATAPAVRAPYNWVAIKKRAERGRYVADRQKQEDDRLQELQQSYRSWLEKEAMDPTSAHSLVSIERPTSLIMEESEMDAAANGDAAVVGDVGAMATGTGSTGGSGYRRFQVPNPKGVDWDLFRQDVIAMCDAAVARDPDEGEDDGPGTLGYAIRKIKEVSSLAEDNAFSFSLFVACLPLFPHHQYFTPAKTQMIIGSGANVHQDGAASIGGAGICGYETEVCGRPQEYRE